MGYDQQFHALKESFPACGEEYNSIRYKGAAIILRS